MPRTERDTQHTVGPWRLESEVVEGGDSLVIRDDDPRGNVIARIDQTSEGVDTYAEALANARLIASAPDLLTAALLGLPFVEIVYREHGRAYVPGGEDALERMRYAIQQASRGR